MQFMVEFVTQTRQQRIIQRNRTERPSELLDWKQLGEATGTLGLFELFFKVFLVDIFK